ncbi:MAG: hypothetical protein A2W28_09205 [Gammaproteobacteria bacterium RBG_16_51_14]|nr:MAG: hypothetical protein A2W28_09205 [Gammaproteobacteria bacterium RBG_16_51_14]
MLPFRIVYLRALSLPVASLTHTIKKMGTLIPREPGRTRTPEDCPANRNMDNPLKTDFTPAYMSGW